MQIWSTDCRVFSGSNFLVFWPNIEIYSLDPRIHFGYNKVLTRWKQPSRSDLRKRGSGNIQQIYRRTSMPKCVFKKVAKQLY